MTDPDTTLTESTRTHRERLASALAYGTLERRRKVNTNLRRFVGSVVLAAVAGVGCLGFSFVMGQIHANRDSQALTAYRAAIAANPIQPGDDVTADPQTGLLTNTQTGVITDPQTGFPVDPTTGLVRSPDGHFIDPRTGWYVDPSTGYNIDPATGVTVDPTTLQVVQEDK